jgi:hypothetical protein
MHNVLNVDPPSNLQVILENLNEILSSKAFGMLLMRRHSKNMQQFDV